MEVRLKLGIKMQFSFSDVEGIYDAIPVKEKQGFKCFNRSTSCAEKDAIRYFLEHWYDEVMRDECPAIYLDVARNMDMTTKSGTKIYSIPKPTEKNYLIMMTLFGYLTFFATANMVESKTHLAILKATHKIAPVLDETWTLHVEKKIKG